MKYRIRELWLMWLVWWLGEGWAAGRRAKRRLNVLRLIMAIREANATIADVMGASNE